MWVAALTKIAGPVLGLFGKKQDRLQKAENAKAKWESKAMEGAISSWKDEFWTIIVGTPIILRMLGALLDLMMRPFGVESGLPDLAWEMMQDINEMLGGNYHVVVMMCVSASFGIRIIPKVKQSGIVDSIVNKVKGEKKPNRVISSTNWRK